MTRRDETRKAEIRAAAIRCFVRRGYASTRLLDIAREVGLSKGGIYFYYRAKEQLFLDITDTVLKRVIRRAEEATQNHLRPVEQLARLVRSELMARRRDVDEARLLQLLVSMAHHDDSTHHTRTKEAFSTVEAHYTKVIERGMNHEEFARGDPLEVARCVIMTMYGMSVFVSLMGDLQVEEDTVTRCVLQLVGFSERPIRWDASVELHG